MTNIETTLREAEGQGRHGPFPKVTPGIHRRGRAEVITRKAPSAWRAPYVAMCDGIVVGSYATVRAAEMAALAACATRPLRTADPL